MSSFLELELESSSDLRLEDEDTMSVGGRDSPLPLKNSSTAQKFNKNVPASSNFPLAKNMEDQGMGRHGCSAIGNNQFGNEEDDAAADREDSNLRFGREVSNQSMQSVRKGSDTSNMRLSFDSTTTASEIEEIEASYSSSSSSSARKLTPLVESPKQARKKPTLLESLLKKQSSIHLSSHDSKSPQVPPLIKIHRPTMDELPSLVCYPPASTYLNNNAKDSGLDKCEPIHSDDDDDESDGVSTSNDDSSGDEFQDCEQFHDLSVVPPVSHDNIYHSNSHHTDENDDYMHFPDHPSNSNTKHTTNNDHGKSNTITDKDPHLNANSTSEAQVAQLALKVGDDLGDILDKKPLGQPPRSFDSLFQPPPIKKKSDDKSSSLKTSLIFWNPKAIRDSSTKDAILAKKIHGLHDTIETRPMNFYVPDRRPSLPLVASFLPQKPPSSGSSSSSSSICKSPRHSVPEILEIESVYVEDSRQPGNPALSNNHAGDSSPRHSERSELEDVTIECESSLPPVVPPPPSDICAGCEVKLGFFNALRMWSCEFCDHTYCKDCVSSKVRESLLRDGSLQIPCFSPRCTYCHSVDAFSLFLDQESVKRVMELKALDINNKPCPSCSFVNVASPEDPTIECPNCGLTYCYFHGINHAGSPCVSHAMGKISFSMHLKRFFTMKKCIQCGFYVKKQKGLLNREPSVCDNCGTHMCWYCLKDCTHVEHVVSLLPRGDDWPVRCRSWRLVGVRVGYGLCMPVVAGVAVGVAGAALCLAVPAVVLASPAYCLFKIYTKHEDNAGLH